MPWSSGGSWWSRSATDQWRPQALAPGASAGRRQSVSWCWRTTWVGAAVYQPAPRFSGRTGRAPPVYGSWHPVAASTSNSPTRRIALDHEHEDGQQDDQRGARGTDDDGAAALVAGDLMVALLALGVAR